MNALTTSVRVTVTARFRVTVAVTFRDKVTTGVELAVGVNEVRVSV